MIELFHQHTSTCSQKVRLCLAEKGLEYVSRVINTRKDENLAPEYLALNPNGLVPTLRHDGNVICDSSVICEYLDEVFPQNPLQPQDPVARAHMRTWMRFLEEVPTVAIRAPSFHVALANRYQGMDEETFRTQHADIRPLRKHDYRRMGPNGWSKEDVEASIEQLDMTLHRMEKALANGPWLVGEKYTLADLVVTPEVDRMDDLGMSPMWTGGRLPNVSNWYARIKTRPNFDIAYYPGSRTSQSGLEFRPLGVPLPI